MNVQHPSFAVECEQLFGLAVIPAYIEDHIDGLLMPENANRLSKGQPLKCCFDTGTNQTAISDTVAKRLTLKVYGQSVSVASPNADITEAEQYLVDILFPNGIVFVKHQVIVVKSHIDILVGMDIIGSGDFALTHRNNKPFLSMVWPHQRTIDFQQ